MTLHTDAVLIASDGTARTAAIVEQSLNSGTGVVVLGRTAHDVVDYLDARLGGLVWPVIADPSDPEQVADVLGRAPQRVGRVRMVIDPAGLIADIVALDERVA